MYEKLSQKEFHMLKRLNYDDLLPYRKPSLQSRVAVAIKRLARTRVTVRFGRFANFLNGGSIISAKIEVQTPDISNSEDDARREANQKFRQYIVNRSRGMKSLRRDIFYQSIKSTFIPDQMEEHRRSKYTGTFIQWNGKVYSGNTTDRELRPMIRTLIDLREDSKLLNKVAVECE